MTDNEIKKVVESEIGKTKEMIVDYKEQTRPIAPDDAIGRISRMDAINNKSVVEAALRHTEERLKKLELVFSKIGSDEFGMCIRCKNPIPLVRIMVMPSSLHCVNCAS